MHPRIVNAIQLDLMLWLKMQLGRSAGDYIDQAILTNVPAEELNMSFGGSKAAHEIFHSYAADLQDLPEQDVWAGLVKEV